MVNTTYTRIGQAASYVQTDEGDDAYPDRVLVTCSTCGAIVAGTMTELHTASHA